MKAGDLKLFTTGPEDRFLNLSVCSNESEVSFEEYDIASLTDEEYINDFTGAGESIGLTKFIDSVEALSISLDAEKQVLITGRYKDAGIETKEYEVIITVEFEVEEIEFIK